MMTIALTPMVIIGVVFFTIVIGTFAYEIGYKKGYKQAKYEDGFKL
jgi:hypothetical protein